MIKRLKFILCILALAALCGGLAACADKKSELEKYDVVVYYDANGGAYENRTGVSVADGFMYSDCRVGEDGQYHLKLTDPTSPARKNPVSLTKPESFFAGWYKTRTATIDAQGNIRDAEGKLLSEREGVYYVTDAEGNHLDSSGNVLIERDGEHYIMGTDEKSSPSISEPVYTYSDYWDFATDTLDCKQGENNSLTLYAGWVSYYTFEYYCKTDGVWTKYGETKFDYKTTNAANSSSADYDTIWVPDWADGVMEHSHKYADSNTYRFPKIEGKTFVAAYADEACTQKIEGSYTHPGSLDIEHARAVDSVKKIYVEFEDVERYRIQTAKQLSDHPNLNGYYTIVADLDFGAEGAVWPSLFVTGTFNGRLCSEEGKTYKISNVEATFSSSSASFGGLFGRLSASAVIGDITFENCSLKIASTPRNADCVIATLFGSVTAGAQVSGITFGGKLLLGAINSNSPVNVNMLVGEGGNQGITIGGQGIQLKAVGEYLIEYYMFAVKPEATTVGEDGKVNVAFATSNTEKQRDKEIIDITTFGGNNYE